MRGLHVPVQVRSRYRDDLWARGFEVTEIVRERDRKLYRVRRRTDGAVLPVLFSEDDVREESADST